MLIVFVAPLLFIHFVILSILLLLVFGIVDVRIGVAVYTLVCDIVFVLQLLFVHMRLLLLMFPVYLLLRYLHLVVVLLLLLRLLLLALLFSVFKYDTYNFR